MSYKRSPQRKLEALSRVITLHEINGESCAEVIGLIYEINREDKNKDKDKREEIQLIINSEGGWVEGGLGIIDVIEKSITPIHTIVHGCAYSMAFAIAISGHYRYASKRAKFMYHEINYETAPEKLQYHEQELKFGKELFKEYNDYIKENTSLTDKELNKVIKSRKDWYMNAEEALKYSIIDEIL